MRINFKRLDMHSFMSFDDETFDFGETRGMTLVCGKNNDIPNSKNGSGKSNLMSALLYVLFGQLQYKIKNENVVNRYINDKDMRLSLEFDVDGKPYKVVRGLKRGKSSYMELSSGDIDLTKSSIQETQDLLEKEIIACDITIFLRTMLLSADQNYNFYMLKKSDKKDFVEKLFDISVFGEIYNAIHKDTLAADKDILARQNRIVVLKRSGDDLKSRSETYDNEKNSRVLSAEAAISKAETEYESASSREVADVSEKVSKLQSAIDKLRSAKDSLFTSRSTTAETVSKLDLARQKLEFSRSSKKAEIDKHAGMTALLCDDCRDKVNSYYKITGFDKEILDLDQKIETVSVRRDDAKNKLDEYDRKIQVLTENITESDKRMRSVLNEKAEAERMALNAKNRVDEAVRFLEKIKNEKNPYKQMLESNENETASELKGLDSAEARSKLLKFAENVVSQDTLRKFIIADLITLLNNKIRTYLTRLGSKYTVVFDADMDYKFITNGGECEFQNFSAGERMRIMIATSFAFRDFMSIRNGLTSNLLILDEYFDSAIDSSCVESIMDVLRGYIRDFKQNIYVISHRTEVSQDCFDKMICIEKTNDISKITYLE